MSIRRIRAVVRKELREYRRNRSIVVGMSIIPFVFLIQPLAAVFATSSRASLTLSHRHELLYMLAIPALVPATLAAYAIVGERQQGTLEPVLGTPVSRDELLIGKALAVLIPSLVISYAVFGVFTALVEIFASPGIAPALIRGPDVLAQVVFTPLLTGTSICIGLATSARAGDVRVAQQLSALASLPTIAFTTLLSLNVIHPSPGLALGVGAGLLAAIRLGWRAVSVMFDRERLVSGPG